MAALRGAFRALHFAARPRVLCKYLGQVLLLLAVLSLVPAAVAVLGDRSGVAWRYAAVIAGFAVLGGLGARVRCTDQIQANEAMVVSALAFLVSGLGMAFPLMGYGIAPIDALFEAISGVTTTGLSTLATVEGRPRTFLFARAWLQWIGGLGVVVLALAFMVPSGVAAKRMGFDEREAADYVGGTRGHAQRILLVYVALTAAGIALCVAAGLGGFDALTHTFAAISTGGFANADASLAGLSPAGRNAVSAICLAGAVSFSLYYQRSLHRVFADAQLWTLLGLVALGMVLLWLAERVATGSGIGADQAAWMAISAQTTAGFSTLATTELSAGGKLVLIGGMLVGGEVGSTAGGLKVLRLLILAQLLLLRVLRVSMPAGAELPARISGSRVRHREVETAGALALAYATVILVSWLAFLMYGHDPIAALFDVVSAISTSGLSAGATAPDLEPALKLVLCLDMLIGRVEVFAWFVLLFPGTWIGRRRSSQ